MILKNLSQDILVKNTYFLSQPHQPFFVLAFVNAIFMMLIFMFAYKGIAVLELPPASFHGYSIIYLLFTPAFLAFIFTTFPRFSSTPPIAREHYLSVFALFLTGSLFFVSGAFFSPLRYSLGIGLLLAGHIWAVKILWESYRLSQMPDKHDIFWILTAMLLGAVSHLLFAVGMLFIPALLPLAIQMAIYLYLFLVGFTIAQRMVPSFSHSLIDRDDGFIRKIIAILIAHILLETVWPHSSFPLDFALAWIIGREVYRWKLPFPNPNPLLWILHISIYWIPVAFLFGGMSNLTALISGENFLFLDIHILILGFLFTILIGFGTRVTIGHSGNMMQADRWTIMLFNWTQVVVVLRLLTSIAAAYGWNYLILFDISATVWLLMFVVWGIRFFPVLVFGKKLR
jgi:uncharacterized protein involved in response to NO